MTPPLFSACTASHGACCDHNVRKVTGQISPFYHCATQPTTSSHCVFACYVQCLIVWQSGHVQIFDLASSLLLETVEAHTDSVTSVAIAPDKVHMFTMNFLSLTMHCIFISWSFSPKNLYSAVHRRQLWGFETLVWCVILYYFCQCFFVF